jgi:protein SCO1/2
MRQDLHTKVRGLRLGVYRLRYALAVCLLVSLPRTGSADETRAPERADVGVTEHLGATLPLDVAFLDHHGHAVTLGDFFGGRRPVLLIFGYHTCPMLCSLVQNATAQALRGIGWQVGREFEVVVISIDPEDTIHEAAKRRENVVATYQAGRAPYEVSPGVVDGGWHYLVGKPDAIRTVADAAGFHYTYDADFKQYAHPAVIQLVSPQGKLARYLYGIEFEAKDIRFGLLEAAAGRSVSTIDRVLLYCVHYDPGSGKYVTIAARVMQIGGGVIVLAIGALLGVLWTRDRRRSSGRASSSPGLAVSYREEPRRPPRSSARSPCARRSAASPGAPRGAREGRGPRPRRRRRPR